MFTYSLVLEQYPVKDSCGIISKMKIKFGKKINQQTIQKGGFLSDSIITPVQIVSQFP